MRSGPLDGSFLLDCGQVRGEDETPDFLVPLLLSFFNPRRPPMHAHTLEGRGDRIVGCCTTSLGLPLLLPPPLPHLRAPKRGTRIPSFSFRGKKRYLLYVDGRGGGIFVVAFTGIFPYRAGSYELRAGCTEGEGEGERRKFLGRQYGKCCAVLPLSFFVRFTHLRSFSLPFLSPPFPPPLACERNS